MSSLKKSKPPKQENDQAVRMKKEGSLNWMKKCSRYAIFLREMRNR